jgi:HD-like signal output (HDOD) protein/CheY-like chemotaxis protein
MKSSQNIEEIIKNHKELPTLPGIAMRILDAVGKNQTNLKEIADIISTDPPLSAKVLKLINSPFYGLSTKITSVQHAINLLGLNTVKNLALSFSLLNEHKNGGNRDFDYTMFWKNSLVSAIAAKTIAQKTFPDFGEDAFFLGLLHNIGILALLQCFPDKYGLVLDKTKDGHSTYHEAEDGIFGSNHMVVGRYLAKSWGLPETFFSPIGHHHQPDKLKTDKSDIKKLTQILHLSSLFGELFHHPDKSLYLGQVEWHLREHRQFENIQVDEIIQHINEQTIQVFPFFELKLESELNYLELIEKARKELINLSADTINQSVKEERKIELQKEQENLSKIPKILIVDDEERNIRLLKAMLLSEEYQLTGVLSGKEALESLDEINPDIILLDVMMPEIDGFEVCSLIKQDEKTRAIPVIIVTALDEKEHRTQAMEAGADDFISKPVDRTELRIRVKSLLRIKSYHNELVDSFREIAQKNSKLQELEKSKEGLTHVIIHDLRDPLTAISGKIEHVLKNGSGLSAEQREEMKNCLDQCDSLNELIQSL